MQERVVSKNEAGQRFDKLLAKYLKLAPPSFLYKMLRKKNITLNGSKATGAEKVETGDVVRFFLADETIKKFTESQPKRQIRLDGVNLAKQMPDIVYEDEHILLMNKPVGMLSQKSKETDWSAVEILISYLLDTKQLKEEELATFSPSVCNRLDRNTSGLLAAGKSLVGLQELSRFFKERTIKKYYLCLVVGCVTETKMIDGWLVKDEKMNKVHILPKNACDWDNGTKGGRIQTEYRPIAHAGEHATLLKVHLITGKPHQIRAHLASIGHPIIGDYKYGLKKINDRYRGLYGLKSQLLHAYELTMPQTDGALSYLSGRTFTAEVPKQFREICDKCACRGGDRE